MTKTLVEKEKHEIPSHIRVSIGTAMVIGLLEGKLDVAPTTAYLMTYKEGKCTANCGFCPQARTSQCKTELLSRVTWPTFSSRSVVLCVTSAFHSSKIRRVCIQALNYPTVFSDLCRIVKALKQQIEVPVSVSCQPSKRADLQCLYEAGVNRIGIPLDVATEKLFDLIKGAKAGGPYRWENQFRQLKDAVEFFGKGNVSTHLIVGLGETEKEAVALIQRCTDLGVTLALFAFTPVRGTILSSKPQPSIETYRRIQLARYLIVNCMTRFEDMHFDKKEKITAFGVPKEKLLPIIESGEPFLTSGCPDCNRPFYNEKPSGPIYNYPRRVTTKEAFLISKQLTLK
ncbi:MAG: radical SAM protein [Candidatus Bathyarchaeota archaeon]|nr:radical SAM protein [Candidatus Bathyarchaeota archaeon]